MSAFEDMKFKERLAKAAAHAKVQWGPTSVARSLGFPKQTVHRWFDKGEPKPAQLFTIADKWRVSARWLAKEEGDMLAPEDPEDRAANPREEQMLTLFRGLTREQQRELIIDTNAAVTANREIQTRLLNRPLRTFSNEQVEAAFGKVPAPTTRKAKPTPKKTGGGEAAAVEEDPE